jgi:sulfhydrogenase subunit beta (sulfur reductase)
VELSLAAGRRWRQYDSCQHLEFALVAGPHNFRPKRSDRVRHRWFRKLVWLNREYGFPFCVGCGRCTQQCTAKISWVDVINTVVAEAMEEARL